MLAIIEELGGFEGNLPIHNSFPQEQETQDVNYVFLKTSLDNLETPQGRWSSGRSLDGRSAFRKESASPLGQEPKLAPPQPSAHAQRSQLEGADSKGGRNTALYEGLASVLRQPRVPQFQQA